jgi:hypothetical protein
VLNKYSESSALICVSSYTKRVNGKLNFNACEANEPVSFEKVNKPRNEACLK